MAQHSIRLFIDLVYFIFVHSWLLFLVPSFCSFFFCFIHFVEHLGAYEKGGGDVIDTDIDIDNLLLIYNLLHISKNNVMIVHKITYYIDHKHI